MRSLPEYLAEFRAPQTIEDATSRWRRLAERRVQEAPEGEADFFTRKGGWRPEDIFISIDKSEPDLTVVFLTSRLDRVRPLPRYIGAMVLQADDPLREVTYCPQPGRSEWFACGDTRVWDPYRADSYKALKRARLYNPNDPWQEPWRGIERDIAGVKKALGQ